MNLPYDVNYLIFSIFLGLLLIEVGFALVSLFAYSKYRKRLIHYIKPIWEVNGTFAVFYLVNFAATYPKLIGPAASLYSAPVLIAAALLVFRNAFLVYGEYGSELEKKKTYAQIYAISTLLIVLIVFSVLSSSFSGIGINLSAGTSSYAAFLNPFNLLTIISALLISAGLASSLFEIETTKKFGWLFIALGAMVFIGGMYLYVPTIYANINSNLVALGVFAILLLALAAAQIKQSKYAKALSVISVIIGINLLALLQYPLLFAKLDVTQFMNNSAISGPIMLITAVGGAIVAISLSYLIYISYLRYQK